MLNNIYEQYSKIPQIIYGSELAEKYGTLSFDITNPKKMTNDPLLFHIYIDVSGSMSDVLNDGRTKIQLLKHTLCNILHYFADKCNNIHVQVKGFDDSIHDYIQPIEVNKTNIKELIQKIDSIRPMNSTDIGLALFELNRDVESEYLNIPLKNRIAIMLTDGEPTSGIQTKNELVNIVKHDCSHHFIALGNEHNGKLMYELGHKSMYTSNWFINDLEHTGNVYGEILFNETHRIFYDNKITVSGGKIYNYNTGEFVTELKIGPLYDETSKNYHLMIEEPDNFTIIISGKNEDDDNMYCNLTAKIIHNITDSYFSNNQEKEFIIKITKQYLRLCVQKLMFELRTQSENETYNREYRLKHIFGISQPDVKPNAEFNDKVTTMYNFLVTYMRLNNLQEDEFILELVKDVNVMKNSYGKEDILNIVSAREESQGQQTAFNTSSQYDDDLHSILPPKLTRAPTSAYCTPGRTDLIRDISTNENLAIITPDDTQDVFGFAFSQPSLSRLSTIAYNSPERSQVLNDTTINDNNDEDEIPNVSIN
jgi:hypothetical protein